MCTVSLIPYPDGVRLMCNRDERHDRPQAEAPSWREAGDRTAIWPRDPQSGGTWVGVNDAGLAAALLNRTTTAVPVVTRPDVTSRGVVVPRALAAPSIDAACTAVLTLDCRQMQPFRLLLVTMRDAAIVTSDGERYGVARWCVRFPLVLTSSSLGDAVVRGPRRRLFTAMLRSGRGDAIAVQRAFHDHQWHGWREVSVRMHRSDAATVSRTCIDLSHRYAALHYEPLDPC